ncbi:GNAT family N-acetyltransferase [Martelella soudanensis]|uniref:GNAT family N-acetyltransferase n=1 Tax=unclassified Martelella TaxID=2629616 RepID=UPI0015DE1F44|nr:MULTISPECIES: GNAT family N-acetyltransferase [unclassified Martelella]
MSAVAEALGPCPVVETPRLRLRPVGPADAEQVSALLADPGIARMLTRVPFPYTLEDAQEWLAHAGGEDRWPAAITQPADGVPIGLVSIERRQGGHHLGYWLSRYYWNRGFMSEAVSGLAERFFDRSGGATLHSGAFTDNPASLKVLQRLGFQVTGLRETWSVSRGRMAQEVTTALTPALFRPYRF